MRDLQYIIDDCFRGDYCTRRHTPINSPTSNNKVGYLEIPIKDSFEIPVFALQALKPKTENLVIELQDIGAKTTYKSIDSGIRDIITYDFTNNKLVKLPTKAGEPIYYGTYGAIFDEDFKPIVMVLWEMEKNYSVGEDAIYPFTYQFIKPILKVNPKVFINKSNSVERYIINKVVSAALIKSTVSRPYRAMGYFDNHNAYSSFPLKVELDYFNSFVFKKPEVPSISTTNEELLMVALDNMEEIVE